MRWWYLVGAMSLIGCRALLPEALDADGGTTRDSGVLRGRDAGPADAGLSTGVTDAGWADCPATLPGTGDVGGATLTREGFGCYGGCGPSCKAECLEDTITAALPNGVGCTRCTYRVTTCKSHEFCRWHDDCYRQCDLRWAESHSEAPKTPPSNPCYLTCDNPVVHASTLCGADWSQLFASSSPSVRDACWDGSIVVFTTLTTTQHATSAAECITGDARVRPWAPNTGDWGNFASPPSTLPRGYSCSDDTDCPDRNQRCDPKAGNYPGVNGWGRCVEVSPSPGVDVREWPASGTRVVAPGFDTGAGCLLGYECASGHCDAQRCR